jgi:hypothetical protein
MKFSQWWAVNGEALKAILKFSWFLPKKVKNVINTIIVVLDYVSNRDLSEVSFDREILPCIRANPDGSTTIVNCKTGIPIKN